jgi:hypothetical protein
MYQLQTLFDQDDDQLATEVLEVVKCQYLDSSKVTWDDLFEGYDEMYASTFSSGIDFTAKLLKKFEYAEIIYGCEGILNSKLSDIIAAQANIIELVCKSKAANELSKMVSESNLRLYVSKDTNSHEKVFVLRSKNGKTRVITGSANMSASAFCGFQREEIIYFDDKEAFDYFFSRFESFKGKCSNKIEESLVKNVITNNNYLKENLENVPILGEANEHLVLNITKDDDDVDIIASIKGMSDEIKQLLPKKTNKTSSITITSDDVRLIRKENRDLVEKKKRERQLPVLHFDYDTEKLSFNNKAISLITDSAGIKNDTDTVIGFLNGFSSFNGKTVRAQKDYYAYLNWYFASLFIPYLRFVANNHGYSLHYFPIFGMLCGPSNAGKTTFVKLLAKLMTGKNILTSSNDVFCARELDKLRANCEGVPIMIEDLALDQYRNNYEKIIKNDEYGFAERAINYPAVSITANKINSLTGDVTKRVVYFRFDISIDKETAARNAKTVNDSIRNAGNYLFAEYVIRMIPRVKEVADNMLIGGKDYSPDILKISSEVLYEIFKEHQAFLPDYIRPLKWNDYFGDKIVGRTAMEKIITAWNTQRNNFEIRKKDNLLSYTIPDTSAHEIGYIVNELPSSLNAKKLGSTLNMDLDAAKEVFGINFKKGWFK